MRLIEAQSISVRRGTRTLLKDVSIAVGRGDFLLIAGPNGAGKSTLARVLLGLEPPSGGSIERPRKLAIGYVPQQVRRDPTLPLSTGGFLRLARDVAPEETRALYGALGVDKLLPRPMANLSGGELRRVALARALMQQPDLLVLDEPLAGVDAASQEPIYNLIAEHGRRTGAGIVLIAHEVLISIKLARQVLCLDTAPLALGPPTEVVASAAFERLFGSVIAAAAVTELATERHAASQRLAADG